MLILLVISALGIVIETYPKQGSPPSRSTNPMAAYDSSNKRLIVLGGFVYETGSMSSTLQEYSLSKSTWKQIFAQSAFIPPGLQAGKILVRDHELLVFYGSTTSGISSDVYIFNMKTLTWSIAMLSGDPIQGREKFASCVYERDNTTYLAIYGGLTSTGMDSSLFTIDIQTLKSKKMPRNGQYPGPKIASALEFYNEKLYLFGYTPPSTNIWPNQTYLYSYDITEETWSVVEDKGTKKPEHRIFHAMVVYNDELYVIYGYQLETVTQLNSVWKFSFITSSWSNLGNYNTTYVAECAIVSINSKVYLIEGRDQFSIYNSIYSVDLSKQSLIFNLESNNYGLPERRRNHQSLIIEGNIVIFGGYYNGNYYNDMWKYSITQEIWTSVSIQGTIPSGRIDFACTQIIGNSFAIFGGQDGLHIYNDLYYYYDYNFNWVLADVVGSTPSPRFSSSMCYYNYKYYIIGGQNFYQDFDEIWLFDYVTSSYSLLSTSSKTSLKLPIIRSHCTIQVNQTNPIIYIVGGSTFQHYPNNQVIQIHLSSSGMSILEITYKQKNPMDFLAGVSETAVVFIKSTAYLFFGSFWNTQVVNYIVAVDLQDGNYTIIMPSDNYYKYGHSAVHFGNAVYLFGGGVAVAGYKIYNTETNLLYKVTGFEVGNSSCSPGTQGDDCQMCSKGTYWKDGICEKCPAGTFSTSIAAISVDQCLPCEEGTFSSNEGSVYCLDCSINVYCPLGTSTPQSYITLKSQSSIQPASYSSQSSSINNISNTMWYSLGGFSIFLFCFVLMFRKCIYRKMKTFDLFSSFHPIALNIPVIYKKTRIGGIFSILFLIAAGVSISIGFISFQLDNVTEIKALVPLIAIKDEIKASSLKVNIQFLVYSDSCTNMNEEFNEINNKGFTFDKNYIIFLKNSTTCNVKIEYKNFELNDNEAYIDVLMKEKNSYSSGIAVNLTVTSSIPNEYSSISTFLYPGTGYVFRGRKSSIIPYTFTPSIFTSESSSWSSFETGYHISIDNTIEYGSLSTQKTISSEINLLLRLKMIKSNTGMSTSRTLKYSWIMFGSTVLGSVFGLFSVFTTIMSVTEQAYKKYKIKIKEKTRKVNNRGAKRLSAIIPMKEKIKFSKVSPLDYTQGIADTNTFN
ncbi:hypothetical protein SteCoe_26658 [Stentor coeruleus]|uniref:Tyrosine-protein kinase ephrin type A/B receptor-like domain-containing protein n=1 Tax=Stentor coeruleus TaxID=5963 RepID=A0A1R2BC96_9CILI|nr:hypothetical protein SteCoe_26658 [Stentor coeruleus]